MKDANLCKEFVLLIDHYNLPFPTITPRTILEAWIKRVFITTTPNIFQIRVRAYGGWFVGNTASGGRFKASEFYQANCPPLFKIDETYCRVVFEFADNLIPMLNSRVVYPGIENTLVERKSPEKIKLRLDVPVCTEPGCEIQNVRRWLRKRRACSRNSCPHAFGDHFYREEQKQVDIHLAMDLIQFTNNGSSMRHVALATDDNDFLPALIMVAVNHPTAASITHVRFENSNTYIDDFLKKTGVEWITVSSPLQGGN